MARCWQCGAVTDEEVLQGGVANAGAVRRVGDVVIRPANEHSATIHALLRHVRSAGFAGVPEPSAFDPGGEEQLTYIPGVVPFPPFPTWSQADAILGSTVALLRRFHDATIGFVAPADATWSSEMADPDPPAGGTTGDGGAVICHNDVCPENVVFRDGVAVALLDFDFAAPGRRVYDLARLALMTVPLDTPEDAARTNRGGLDPFTRLRVVADGYGLARAGPHSSTPSSATSPAEATFSSVGSTPVRRPSSPWWRCREGWSATTGVGRGSRHTGNGFWSRWVERSSRLPWARKCDKSGAVEGLTVGGCRGER